MNGIITNTQRDDLSIKQSTSTFAVNAKKQNGVIIRGKKGTKMKICTGDTSKRVQNAVENPTNRKTPIIGGFLILRIYFLSN